MLRHISDAVITVDQDFCISSWNPAAEIIYGWEEKQVIGQRVSEVLPTEYREGSGEKARTKLEFEGEWQGEVVQKHRNGAPIIILSSVTWINDSSGQRIGAVAVNRDITRQKKAEDTLRENEKRFERVVRATTDAIWDWDLLADTVWWSKGVCNLFGYYKREVSPKSGWWLERIHPDDQPQVSESLQKLFESQDTYWECEYRFKKADGTYAWVLDKGSVERNATGQACRMMGGMSDITSRMAATELLRKSEERFAKAFHLSPAAQLIICRRNETVLDVNESFAQLVGYDREEIIGKKTASLNIVERDQIDHKRKIVEQKGIIRNVEQTYRTASGELLRVLVSDEIIELEGEPCHLIIAVDITPTPQKKAEEALRKSEESFTKIFNASPAAQVIVRKSDRQILHVNESCLKLIGCPRQDLVGRSAATLNIFTDKQREEFKQQLVDNQGVLWNTEMAIRTASGQKHTVLTSVEPLELDSEACLLVTSIDITKRKKAEQKLLKLKNELAQLERQFRGLVENSKDLFTVATPEGIHYVSNNVQQILGYTPEEYKQLKANKLSHPDDPPARWDELKKPGDTIQITFRGQHKNGEWRWMEGTATNLSHVKEVGGILFTLRDITKKKLTEDALRGSEIRFKALVEASSQIVWTTEVTGEVREDSPSWRKFTGQTYEQWKGYGWLEAIHPEDRARVAAEWQTALQQEVTLTTEYRLKNAVDEWRWTLVRAVPLRNGKIYGWVGMNSDITVQKKAEEAVRESESRLKQLTESLPQLVWTCQPDGSCDYLSKQWVEYTGIPEEEQLGFAWLEQLHPDDREATIAAWNQAVETNTDFRVEFRIRCHDGQYRWFDTLATRLYDVEGQLLKWFGTNTDIEDKKQIELENKRVNDELDKFVYSASHDLRSPLVGIMGLLSVARNSVEQPALIQEYLNKMQGCTEKLDAILQSILEYSYNNRYDLKIEAVDIRTLVDDCFTNLADVPGIRAVEKRIEVHQSKKLQLDRHRLELIFKHLLKNAIQFRDTHKQHSTIHITVKVADSLEISVRDNGTGIKRAHLPKVFDMFYRASNQSQGAGLGLYITKEVVTKLKGKIEVQSHLEKGTIFIITIPITKLCIRLKGKNQNER
uniref:histidine kinase n=1 Tax=Roseihalotalea indica TaxID=2867963 RepID=A0AA49GQP5_9BACT|nr:PAS domain S-box protein [Tunicatimonas sp. TK19036]